MKEYNELSRRLFADGYTKDSHPDYVQWDNYEEFEYTSAFLYGTVWESPCGILMKGHCTSGYLCYMGTEYRVENNNYNFHCPYLNTDCELQEPTLKKLKWGGTCIWHMTDKVYDYENSAEKLKDERHNKIMENLKKRFGTNGMIHCACCHINERTCEPYFKFRPDDCIKFMHNGCDNIVCEVTKKERNLNLANIYYDVKTTYEVTTGFVNQEYKYISKGCKYFDSKKDITDLELWLKINKVDTILRREESRRSRDMFICMVNNRKFKIEILNVRIEAKESRDLLQDLQDIRDGISITHASDTAKATKQIKKDKIKKNKEVKASRLEKQGIKRLKQIVSTGFNENGEQVSDIIVQHAKDKLKEKGVEIYIQESIFDFIN